jgi:hypothetical protein
MCLGSGKVEGRRILDSTNGGGKAKKPQLEFLSELLQERASRLREILDYELTSRDLFTVDNLHATRVIEQDSDEATLRNNGREDQDGTKEAEKKDDED